MLNKHNKLPVQKLALYIQLSMTFETLVVFMLDVYPQKMQKKKVCDMRKVGRKWEGWEDIYDETL